MGRDMIREKFDLVVFGGVCCDLIFSGIERLPAPGEEIWAEGMKVTVGGAFNVAAAATRLNMKTGIPCICGNDIFSTYIYNAALEEGMDTRLFLRTPQPYVQTSVVLNFGSDRAFVSYAENKNEAELEQHIEEIADQVPMRAAVFGMTDKENYLELMKKLRRKGTKVVLDCCWDEKLLVSESLREQIINCDYFLPNLAEAKLITGEDEPERMLGRLQEYNPNCVIKLGKDGVIASDGADILRYPAIDLGKVIDTTGAGDNFVAGFTYGVIQRESLESCILYGQLCGSKSTVAVGGFTSSLYESELKELALDMRGIKKVRVV